MLPGARVTDAVDWYRRRGDARRSVKIVRARQPERFRWRMAVAGCSVEAALRLGRDRLVIEEPIRELILDLDDRFLRREVVLDARKVGVDLDRGEVLPFRTMGDLRRIAFLVGTEVGHVARHLPLPGDFSAPIDVAGAVLVGRAYAEAHRKRAQSLWLQLPDPDGPERYRLHHRIMDERARTDADLSRRWAALAKALADDEPAGESTSASAPPPLPKTPLRGDGSTRPRQRYF